MTSWLSQVPTTIHRRKRRSISLQVTQENQLKILAPNRVPEKKIQLLIQQNASWIQKKIAENTAVDQEIGRGRFFSGKKIRYLGEILTLHVLQGSETRPVLAGSALQVGDQGKWSTNETLERRIVDWLRERSDEILHDRVSIYANHIGLQPKKVQLRSMKTRWGSCSSRGHIAFNWKLIMAPLAVIDYVVVHELCHLRQMNHSPKFWALVNAHFPEADLRRKWLKDQGKYLDI